MQSIVQPGGAALSSKGILVFLPPPVLLALGGEGENIEIGPKE
jgi:hypothetical protein